MRYLARRILTGEWIDRDLSLTGVERTRTYSGPSIITGNVAPEMLDIFHDDGLRVLEGWGTFIYVANDDSGELRLGGIVVPPIEFAEESTNVQCVGVTGYPQGFIYEGSKLWGPSVTLPRPDPVVIYRELWDYVQSFPNSDLGVTLAGAKKSTQFVGDNEDPFRLRWWESPNIGEVMDNLAAETPFAYREHYRWANDAQTEVVNEVEIGYPRLGIARPELTFALGENIIEPPPVTRPEQFANNVIGIGNGEGSTLTSARASKPDGRLRRTAVYTDKTIRSKEALRNKVSRSLEVLAGERVEIGSIKIMDHKNARISQIEPGDDIYVQTYVPAYGRDVEQWERVVGITQGEDDWYATLTLIATDQFAGN